MFEARHNPVQKTDPFGTVIIDSFRNEFDFLSNFHTGAPITLWGVTFSTSEHAYQWSKTLNPAEKESILFTSGIPTTPGQCKRAGGLVTKREDWETYRIESMREVLFAKFTQHWGLRQKLLATGDALLVEGNTWCDNTWGACTCPKCEGKDKLNLLGNLLMELREKLRQPVYCHGCPCQ